MPISEALKRGLDSLHREIQETSGVRPFNLYETLDLGPGGYASVPSTETRRGVIEALRKKRRR